MSRHTGGMIIFQKSAAASATAENMRRPLLDSKGGKMALRAKTP
tara:strand:+ start:27729 stop:27860 length:132 start_codon:yes stop_codon:yes gene_type:complete